MQQITILGKRSSDCSHLSAICGLRLTAIVAAQLLRPLSDGLSLTGCSYEEIRHQLSIATEQNPQDINSAIFRCGEGRTHFFR